ncbi:MAG: hypothetical protein A4E35_00041 [Methanoregula sp. PtaU1.Bin051]|nr:MAG: hypothetical protein A4E35_00041 [Methanoregula sp. PtaU1.Bin051]
MVIEMEKKWFVGFFLVILTIALSLVFMLGIGSNPAAGSVDSSDFANQNGDIAGSLSYQIDMNSSMPANPETILVYKTNPPIVNKETTLALAKKFNVTGTLRGDCVVQSDDLMYGLEILKISGSTRYTNANRPNELMDSPNKLPSDKEAERIATQFLEGQDLFPKGAYFSGIERYYVKSMDKNGNEIQHYGRIEVKYGRALNNIKVIGSGITVAIGGNGDIIEYSTIWREYTPVKGFPLKSPETAFAELKKVGVKTGIETPSRVTINNVYLAYASKAPAFEEDYLEPVWVFKGEKTMKDAQTRPVTEYIPALTDDAVKSLSSS